MEVNQRSLPTIPEGSSPVVEGSPVPRVQKKSPVDTTAAEKLLAWLVFPLCYCFVSAFLRDWGITDGPKIMIAVFTAGFLILGEIVHWKEPRNAESFLWLGVELLLLAVFLFGALPLNLWAEPYTAGQSPWDEIQLVLFLQLFGMYWLMARSNRFAEGKTGHMFLWDGITLLALLPFKYIYMQACAIVSCFLPKRGKDPKAHGLTLLFSVLAAVGGMVLLFNALRMLSGADRNFAAFLERVFSFLSVKPDLGLLLRLYVTIHVSAYIYGLFSGTIREEKERFTERGNAIKAFVAKLNKVPDPVWITIIAVFSVFYLVFFGVQGTYLFGSFRSALPEGFTYSAYAREGFFELCRVVIINFTLLWIAFRTGRRESAGLKIAGIVLLFETLLFDLIAFAKLFMYIREYALTPLRVESMWWVTSLFAACVCIFISILWKKKTARFWFIFSAVSLAVTAVI